LIRPDSGSIYKVPKGALSVKGRALCSRIMKKNKTSDSTGAPRMRIIKKYPNRRLYDTETSSYIKLAEVHTLIKNGEDFKVVDANTGDDITRSILIQIIIDQESGERRVFTTDMLTNFIRSYDEASHGIFGEFLEKNLQFFAEQQKKFMQPAAALGIVDNPFPKMVQDMTERNLNMWKDMQQGFIDMATGAAKKTKE
jgi:polyhydroxyalkanoate synthesis repressor PhaR